MSSPRRAGGPLYPRVTSHDLAAGEEVCSEGLSANSYASFTRIG